ncbi:MAG: NTP transferase domain-containing protein, partial [Fulvivirga sp.]|nr:NTP transferase domain-containing protein [Fulvivirga sp.]
MTSKEISEVYGLVLTGGRSTRMKQDKSLLCYHQKPQYIHLYEQLKQFLPQVYISVRENDTKQLPAIVDTYNIESPLNGILSAFEYNSRVAWLVVACDMPFIQDKDMLLLLKQRDHTQVATTYIGTDGNPHPLFTIYEPAARDSLLQHAKNSLSPRDFLLNYP